MPQRPRAQLLHVKAVIVKVNIRGKTALVAQQVANGQGRFPCFHLFESREFRIAVVDFQRVIRKSGPEKIDDFRVDVEAAFRDQFLQRIIDGHDFCDACQIIQRIRGDSGAVGPCPVRMIAVQASPGLRGDQAAMADNRQLCTGKAVINVGLNEIGYEPERFGIDSGFLR